MDNKNTLKLVNENFQPSDQMPRKMYNDDRSNGGEPPMDKYVTHKELYDFKYENGIAHEQQKTEMEKLRGEINTHFAEQETKMERQFANQTKWIIGTALAIAGIIVSLQIWG